MYKEKIESLKNAIVASGSPDTTDHLEYIEFGLAEMGEYVKCVMQAESAIQIARFRMSGEDFREYVMRYDRSRRNSHNSCISSISLINNLAILYNEPQIFPVDGMDRNAIADDIIKVIVDEYFEDREK